MRETTPTGVSRPADRPQQMEMDELPRTAGIWHDDVFSRPEPDHAKDIEETVLKDVRAGAARSPKERTRYDSKFGRDKWRSVARFGGWQGDKFRRIGDSEHSLHNLDQGISEDPSLPTRFHSGRWQSAADQDQRNGDQQN